MAATIKKSLIFLLFFIIVFSFFVAWQSFIAPEAQAANFWDKQYGGDSVLEAFDVSGTPEDVRLIVSKIVRVFLGFLGIIFLVLLILAGYRWMTAGGNSDKASEAQKQIRTAVIGLVIIMMSYGIASYVTTCVYEIGPSASFWWCT